MEPVQSTQIPGTVQAVLATRIDLPPLKEKGLLQSGAVPQLLGATCIRSPAAGGQSRSLDHQRPEAPVARDDAAGDRTPTAAAARLSGVAATTRGAETTGHSGEGTTGGSGCPVLLPCQFRGGVLDSGPQNSTPPSPIGEQKHRTGLNVRHAVDALSYFGLVG